MATGVTASEFARIHGVAKSAVHKWGTKGLLVRHPDGSIDVKGSNARLAQRPRRYRGGTAKGPHDDSAANANEPARGVDWSTSEALRHREIYTALMRQLEYEERNGTLVKAAEVAKRVASEYLAITTALLGIKAKLAPRAAAMSGPEALEIYDTQVREVLTALSGGSDGRPL
jgi:hypothetical protein